MCYLRAAVFSYLPALRSQAGPTLEPIFRSLQ